MARKNITDMIPGDEDLITTPKQDPQPAAMPHTPEIVTPRANDVVTSRDHETTTPRAQEITTPRRQDRMKPGRRTAPSAADSVAFTIRFDAAEAIEIDAWVLSLRQELGRGRLDKSEVLRALITIARKQTSVQRALIRSLK